MRDGEGSRIDESVHCRMVFHVDRTASRHLPSISINKTVHMTEIPNRHDASPENVVENRVSSVVSILMLIFPDFPPFPPLVLRDCRRRLDGQ